MFNTDRTHVFANAPRNATRILEVEKHYKRFCNRDSDNNMDWYCGNGQER